jgi:hypothetical protein
MQKIAKMLRKHEPLLLNCTVSSAWQPSGAKTNPQILLEMSIFWVVLLSLALGCWTWVPRSWHQ